MTQSTDDIYDLREPVAPPLLFEAPMDVHGNAASRESPNLDNRIGEDDAEPRRLWVNPIPHLTAHGITWLVAALLLFGGAVWAFRAGMRLRTDVWQSTRTIRFKDDIAGGYRWGLEAIRFSEQRAHLDPRSDALADQSPKVLSEINRLDLLGKRSATFRRLTYRELIDGIVAYCDDRVAHFPDNPDLDYPPLRLAAMAVWARHVQRAQPMLDEFPQQRMEDTSLRQPEDIAKPMLLFNAYCTALAAAAMFFLVWLWIWRGAKVTRMFLEGAPPRWLWHVPHGMVAFIFATSGFWFAFTRLVGPPPRPAPALWVEAVEPHGISAQVILNLNTQNQNSQWHVDWGTTSLYGQSTPMQGAGGMVDDQRLSADLQPLLPNETIHFRVVARNDSGVTTSDDISFIHDGKTREIQSAVFGGVQWPALSVWLRLLALFVIMLVSARILPPLHRGWACGAVAAALLWFNPMVILVSNAWPQWDAWVLPAFLIPALLASLDCWLLAGFVIGIGIMFKGQVGLGSPVLLLWPLFAGRFGACVRVCIGLALGAALVTWPWIIQSPDAIRWIESVMLAAAIVSIAAFLSGRLVGDFVDRIWNPVIGKTSQQTRLYLSEDHFASPLAVNIALVAVGLAAITLATWMIFHSVRNAAMASVWLKLLLLLVIATPWLLPRRFTIYWALASLAASVWISTLLFPASWSWLALGFEYGSVKHDQMQMSVRSLANLPTILARDYSWDIHDVMGTLSLSFSTPGPVRLGRFLTVPSLKWNWSDTLDVKQSMTCLYAVCLVICSMAAAIHSRRKDPKILAALIVPWAIFPVVMCQMGDRYLIWIAAFSSAMVAISMGMTLLHVTVSLLASAMLMNHLLIFDNQRWPAMQKFLQPTFPGVAWLTITIAAVFLISACIPSRRST